MKKRLTALFLAFALICALLPAAVLTASAATYSGTCGDEWDGSNLTWTLDTDTGVLEISGNGRINSWWNDNDKAPWYTYQNVIQTVVIGNGVTSIGDRAFSGLVSLRSVTIGSSVTGIGNLAFKDCNVLTSVIIPDGVIYIGTSAFENCTALTNVTIPDSVTIISWSAFDNTGLFNDESNWADGVLYIEDCLIRAKASSTSGAYQIKPGTRIIAGSAFESCSELTSVMIPDSVTSIGESAFNSCTGLTRVTIPDSVTEIGAFAFGVCTGLTSVTIPSSVTNVSEAAFYRCTGLTSVTIGSEGISHIAFSNCTALKSVTMLDGVKYIQMSAFNGCSSLTDVTIPDSVTYIANWAFAECESLKSVFLPASITSIGGQAFGYWFDNDAEGIKVEGFTIYGYTGTAAEEYANNEGFAFVAVDSSFQDVSDNAWYYDAVNYAVRHGLMNGVGNGNFAPDSPMTRAMLVTVLWRYENSPKEGTNTFSDVPAGQWYTDAVAWAAANGIVGGVGGGKFDPNGNITREQMAAILYRYAQKKGFDTSAKGNLSKFPDAGKVSDWAKDAIAWAVGEGIIGGSDGKLLPQGNATRAQVSTILMRFIENAKEATPYDTQGHTYEFVRGMYSWEEAQKTAKEKGGYLVRFDSEDEFKYVVAEIAKKGYQDTNFIIGARRADGSKDYYFVDADDKPVGGKLNAASSWTTAYWASGEPTYEWDGEQEWIVAVEYKAAEAKWTLNDIPDSAAYPTDPNCHGFIIEHEP